MKTCNRCKIEKEFSAFHKNARNKDGLNNRCGKCTVEYNNERYRKNDSMKKYQKDYWNGNVRKLKKYGLSVEQYREMLSRQGNCCAICKQELIQQYVDHCHTTGKVRGILCLKCNTGIGLLGDSIEYLQNAISYLQASLV